MKQNQGKQGTALALVLALCFAPFTAHAQETTTTTTTTTVRRQLTPEEQQREHARRIEAARRARMEMEKKTECNYAENYTGLQGQRCTQAVTQMNDLSKRTKAVSESANTMAMVGTQVAAMRSNGTAQGTQSAQSRMMNTSSIAMMTRGAAELSEGMQLRTTASQLDQTKQQMDQRRQAFAQAQCNSRTTVDAYNECVAAVINGDAHEFGSGQNANNYYRNHLGQAYDQTAAVAEKASSDAKGKMIAGAASLASGVLMMKMAKQANTNATNLSTPLPNIYGLAAPTMGVVATTDGASAPDTGSSGDNPDLGGLPGTGGSGIRGGLANRYTGSGTSSSYVPGLTSAAGGSSGGSAGGSSAGSSKNSAAAAKRIPGDKNLGDAGGGSGQGWRVGGGNPASATNDLAKQLAGLLGGKEQKPGAAVANAEDRKPASENELQSSFSVQDMTIFDQVSSKIRWLNRSGVI